MSTSSAGPQATIQEGYEPIPGYRVESLLGRGGFGEVWKCEAPGGLKKAIKFVYGAMDQDRATRELKSLNRIKGVQHPFLLTLERFEFVEGRLVIVTELADGSMEDEFTQRRARGSCGIPREQLLSSLSDAADALDYLHQRHGLLHLDVKPGNLLVLGGHVKVADFGLLKDLKELECSIVGGLTPVYAPPELFDGRPSLHSDQYSLAVMYQEMLTGVRPFSGRTIAQLATQHVHAAPNLTPLMPSDRPIIARALEKNPDRRFRSCCEFITALSQSGERSQRVSSDRVGGPIGGYDHRGSDTAVGQFPGLIGGPGAKVADLPSLEVDSKLVNHKRDINIGLKHAMVIALGGTGLDCLDKLHRLMAQPMESMPLVVHGLVIDTDADMLHRISEMPLGESSSTIHSLYVPLRKPQEYREIQGERLRSISRRWVFNVPRSGNTEGMRPLGRLALVDNGQKVSQVIGNFVSRYCQANGENPPAVYVVGSLDGGTSSGMIFDVVHLLRHWLDQKGLEHAKVFPLLATRALAPTNSQSLAGHNAACALGEMRHLIRIANGYPGDSAVNWPSVPAARSPLNDAYLIASGRDDLSVPSPPDTIAEYIWLDSVFAGELLEAARESDGEQRLEDLASASLRSTGIVRLAFQGTIEETLHAPLVALRLASQWCGDEYLSDQAIDSYFMQLVPDDRFECESVMRSCLGNWSDDLDERLMAMRSWFGTLSSEVLADPKSFNGALTKLADKTLGRVADRDRISMWNAVRHEILNELAHRRISLQSAVVVVDRLCNLVREAQASVESYSKIETVFPSAGQSPTADEMIALSERWLWRSACQIAGHTYAELMVAITATKARLEQRQTAIRRCVDGLTTSLNAQNAPRWEAMSESWQLRAEAALRRLNGRTAPSMLLAPLLQREDEAAHGVLSQLLEDATSIVKLMKLAEEDAIASGAGACVTASEAGIPQWREASGNEATTVASVTNSDASTHDTLAENQPMKDSSSAGDLPGNKGNGIDYRQVALEAVKAVRPQLLDCGGSQRMLLLIGNEAECKRWEPVVREAHTGSLTTILVAGIAPTLVCEAQKIKLSDVRSRVISTLGGREDVLGRLHSRCDVVWS
ncbi:MAG TPA: protein kinase [Planctomycetaceae bacterium]|nr:protein kinase [Planctomycetaceae bacterium]